MSDLENYGALDTADARFAAAAALVGEEKMAALEAGGASRNHYTEIWKFEPEMTYMPNGVPVEGMTYVNVGRHHVKPGMDKEYRAVAKDVVAALTKISADATFAGYSIPFGNGSYAFVSWGADRGALHSKPEMGAMLVEAVGPEGARALWERWAQCINGVEERDWAIRPELSFAGVAMDEEAAE